MQPGPAAVCRSKLLAEATVVWALLPPVLTIAGGTAAPSPVLCCVVALQHSTVHCICTNILPEPPCEHPATHRGPGVDLLWCCASPERAVIACHMCQVFRLQAGW